MKTMTNRSVILKLCALQSSEYSKIIQTPFRRPAKQTSIINCNLPDSERHVTRPNQGLSALAPGVVTWETLGTRLPLPLTLSFFSYALTNLLIFCSTLFCINFLRINTEVMQFNTYQSKHNASITILATLQNAILSTGCPDLTQVVYIL